MSIYKEKLLDELSKGSVAYIPNQYGSMGDHFNITPFRYYLVGSVAGVGKTSFVDDAFILKPFNWVLKNRDKVYFECLYFSMERPTKFKLAKFASWKLYDSHKKQISSDTILKLTSNRKLTLEENKLVHGFKPWMDELFEYVDIQEGSKSVSEIAREIENLRKRLGTLYVTDNTQLYQEDKPLGILFGKDFKKTKRGNIPIVRFKIKDKIYELERNKKLFIPKKDNMVALIILDHIGKVKAEGYNSKKQALDAVDELLAEARDMGFTVIPISQFNRSLSDVTRMKYSKGNLEPIYEDFKDTGNLVESADLVLSVFNPYKYQSYDDKGEYKGYKIQTGTLSPSGSQRFRSLHILKNSFGVDNVAYGLKFLGESMYFSVLPRPDEFSKLMQVYSEIAQGK